MAAIGIYLYQVRKRPARNSLHHFKKSPVIHYSIRGRAPAEGAPSVPIFISDAVH
jgi:hypothetical protein